MDAPPPPSTAAHEAELLDSPHDLSFAQWVTAAVLDMAAPPASHAASFLDLEDAGGEVEGGGGEEGCGRTRPSPLEEAQTKIRAHVGKAYGKTVIP